MASFNGAIESIKNVFDQRTVLLLTRPSLDYKIRKAMDEYSFKNKGKFFHIEPSVIDYYTFNFSKKYVPAWWPHKETWWLSGQTLIAPGFIHFSNVEKMDENVRDKAIEVCISRQFNGHALVDNYKIILSIAPEDHKEFELAKQKILSNLEFFETFKVVICEKY